MAQTLKTKVRNLATQFNIDAIIDTAIAIKEEIADETRWSAMTDQEKTNWFFAQCQMHGFTATIKNVKNEPRQIIVKEFSHYDQAYFTAFLPHKEWNDDPWHLEIGGAYATDRNGGIWVTARGLKGKEQQIAEVVRLHKLGQ